MNYATCNEPKAGVCAPDPIEPLTEMMKSTSNIASDVLAMTYRIQEHLFGLCNPCCEKEASPKCFRDELVKTKCEILATAEELSRICSMLGV